jgi:hypothetical protein
MSMGPTAQGYSDWVFSWSVTKGCATVNLNTGSWWAFCTSSCSSSTPAGGTFATTNQNCWGSNGVTEKGVHDILGNETFVDIAQTGDWTEGGCSGLGSGSGPAMWTIGTGTNQWCNNLAVGQVAGVTPDQCGSHEHVGIAEMITPGSGNVSGSGPNQRTMSSVNTFTQFLTPTVSWHDSHQVQPHLDSPYSTYDDLMAVAGATDGAQTTQTSGCTGSGAFVSAVYCPTFPQNELFLWFPTAGNPQYGKILTVAHTGECGANTAGWAQCADGLYDSFGSSNAIGVVSPKGDMFAWVTTDWHQQGLDDNANPRADVAIVYLGAPMTFAATPAFLPVAGTYVGTQSVTISCSTGPVACYNTTGSPATNGTTGCTTGTLYSTAVTVSTSETLYAACGGTNYLDTPASSVYTINAVAPGIHLLTPGAQLTPGASIGP